MKDATIRELLVEARWRLSSVTDTPELDSQVLLAHVLSRPRAWLFAHPEACPAQNEAAEFARLLAAMVAGTPMPYLIGQREFYGLDFYVTPAVLIPRPETELCVSLAIEWCTRHPGVQLGVDIGTGSGCIAASLAYHVPGVHLLASDISFAALQVARRNISRHSLDRRILALQADLLPPASQLFGIICANLPYIPTSTLIDLPVYRQEPVLALEGGPDGLSVIRRLLSAAPSRLAVPGCLLLEIEAAQGQAALSLARAAFPDASVQIKKDLAGRDRVVKIEQ